MPWPIFYDGKILFRNGQLAFSKACCCGTSYTPCCFESFGARSSDLDLIVTIRSTCSALDGEEFDLPFLGEWFSNVNWARGSVGAEGDPGPVVVGGCVSFEVQLQCQATEDGVGDFVFQLSSDSSTGSSTFRCIIVQVDDFPVIRGRCSPDFFLEYGVGGGFAIAESDPEGTPCACCNVGDLVWFEFRLANP